MGRRTVRQGAAPRPEGIEIGTFGTRPENFWGGHLHPKKIPKTVRRMSDVPSLFWNSGEDKSPGHTQNMADGLGASWRVRTSRLGLITRRCRSSIDSFRWKIPPVEGPECKAPQRRAVGNHPHRYRLLAVRCALLQITVVVEEG